MNPLVPTKLDWPSAIGSFLLNFGSLEYFVFAYLKDRLPVDEFAKVKDWHLKDRLKRVADYLAETRHSQQEQEQFAALAARLTPLRNMRNLIAHGQMHLVGLEGDKPKIVMLQAKDVDRDDAPAARELEFGELERALTELAALSREFEQLAGFNAKP